MLDRVALRAIAQRPVGWLTGRVRAISGACVQATALSAGTADAARAVPASVVPLLAAALKAAAMKSMAPPAPFSG